MRTETIHFHLDGVHNRVASAWNIADADGIVRRGIRAAARAHAREHGAAGMWFASDKFTMFYRDLPGKVRQVTWRTGLPLRCACHPGGAA